MKRIIPFIAIVCFFGMGVQTFASEATIVDKKDVKVELTNIQTKEINFQVAKVWFTIPIETISTIRLAEDGKTMILRTIEGKELKGTSYSKLEGTWELGKYSVALSDIKSVYFDRVVQPQQTTIMTKQLDGFLATVTDLTGMTMEVFSFSYYFTCTYNSGFGKIKTDKENRMYFPFQYKEAVVAIPFAHIDAIKFKDNNKESSIMLRDGSTLTGELVRWGYNWSFKGKTEYGGFSLPVEDVRQVILEHKGDKNATRVGPKGDIRGDLNSVYSISLKTWQGNQIMLRNGCVLNLKYCNVWTDLKTEFRVNVGESSNIVDFNKIKSIQFHERGNREAQLTTTTGNTIDISLYGDIWLGGNFNKFGPSRINISEVTQLTIGRDAKP